MKICLSRIFFNCVLLLLFHTLEFSEFALQILFYLYQHAYQLSIPLKRQLLLDFFKKLIGKKIDPWLHWNCEQTQHVTKLDPIILGILKLYSATDF